VPLRYRAEPDGGQSYRFHPDADRDQRRKNKSVEQQQVSQSEHHVNSNGALECPRK